MGMKGKQEELNLPRGTNNSNGKLESRVGEWRLPDPWQQQEAKQRGRPVAVPLAASWFWEIFDKCHGFKFLKGTKC